MNANNALKIGDRVKLTGKFLKSTGQQTGREGATVFTVVGFDGNWAVVDQKLEGSYFTDAEIAANPSLAFRRIALGNLFKVGTTTPRNDP